MKRHLLVVLFALFVAGTGAAQNMSREPGYIDLGTVDAWFNTEPKIEVNLKGSLLKMVMEAARTDDPELAAVLRKLTAIEVRGFDLPDNSASVARKSADLGKRIESMGWETVAKVREDEERVAVYIKTRGNLVQGMLVMALDASEGEAVFVNIVGDIDPAEIGRIGSKLHIQGLGDVKF